jgi:integrase
VREEAPRHTAGHRDCPACETLKRAITELRYIQDLAFPAAAHAYLRARHDLSAGARAAADQYLKALLRFFELLKLRDIHVGHIEAYQRSRQEEIRASKQHKARHGDARLSSDGASRINHEISLLGRVLGRAGLWEPIKAFYHPLPLPDEGPGIALSPEEERCYFKLARSNPRWLIAYCCAVISRNTTAGPAEMRLLRVKDVRLQGDSPSIFVRESRKTEFRYRAIPINAEAAAALRLLLARHCEQLRRYGLAESPEHYLIPARARARGASPDFSCPIGSWKTAHYALRAELAKRFPRLARMRKYDWRHTGMTVMLEDAATSYSTIEKLAGHRINSRTKQVYDHVRDGSLRAAVQRASSDSGAGQVQAPAKEVAISSQQLALTFDPGRKPIAAAAAASSIADPGAGTWLYLFSTNNAQK